MPSTKHITQTILCFLLLVSGSPSSYAQTPEIITNYSYPERSTDLESFLNEDLGVPRDVLKRQGYLQKIEEWNPHLQSKTPLRPGEEVYIELPYGTPIQNRRPSQRYSPPLAMPSEKSSSPPTRQVSQTLSTTMKPSRFQSQGFNLRATYMVSTGLFDQNTLTGVTASTQQNSPITIGLSGGHQLTDNCQLQAHTYLAKFNGVSSEIEVESSIPWQYEFGVSARYSPTHWPVAPVFGMEIERLSTFNILELSSGAMQVLDTQEDNLFLATFGGELTSTVFDHTLNMTPSLSRIISSSNFTGTRLQVQLQAQAPSSAWSYHLLVRHYLMNAPEQELKLTRFGIGVGFQFF